MSRATSMKSFTDNSLSSCQCLCVSSSGLSINTNVTLYSHNNLRKRRHLKKLRLPDLSSPFLDAWPDRRLSAKTLSNGFSRHGQKSRGLVVIDELGGQYEDTFNDVKMELINYFTFKAVRTVLEQLYEMNPPQYKWFNNFVADNTPNKSTRFLQILVKEKRELAERVMITRLSLYGRWIKKCNHGDIYEEISEENLRLMRERLLETIQWLPDDNAKADDTTD